MATRPCPICGRPFDLEASSAPPFCSQRCRLIDLNRWMGEKYALPHIPREDEPAEEPDCGDQRDESAE